MTTIEKRKPGRPPHGTTLVMPPLMREMRRICRSSPEDDKNELQRALRKYFIEDFPAFSSELASLEREWLKATQRVMLANKAAKLGSAPPTRSNDSEDDEDLDNLLGSL